MNREDFEKLTEIAHIIQEGVSDNLMFIPEANEYNAEMYITFVPDYVHYLNGAWYAYQEQQKKIDELWKYISCNVKDGNIYDAIEEILK